MYVIGKMILVETFSNEARGIKKNDGRGEFKYNIFNIL
jgi:hypothetical protein